MFAVDHAATALLIKRRYPTVPMTPVLIAVQAMEIAWVILNYFRMERTTTDGVVRSVADIHLAYMPYSHSVGTALGAALLAWLVIEKGFGRATLGRAVAIGIASHLVLDLLTHARDIVLWPSMPTPKLGIGLYNVAPFGAFLLEMVYGILCWRVYRGGRALFALIVIGNLMNLSLLSADVPGPESLLAGRPLLVVSLVSVQIIVTLVLVGVLSRSPAIPSCNGVAQASRTSMHAPTRLHY